MNPAAPAFGTARPRPWACVALCALGAVLLLTSDSTARQAILAGGGRQQSALVDANALINDLKTLSSDEMEGRAFGTAGGARARAFVEQRFKSAGIQPLRETYVFPFAARTTAGERRGANVIGVIPGTTRATRYLVLSAHYDHVGIQGGQIYNGADDNASGTAALFAIADYVARHPLTSSLLIAAFDGEEADLAGSRAFLRDPPVERRAMAMDINMDMIGRDPNDTLFVVGTGRQPQLKAAIDRVAANAPVRLRAGHEGGATGQDWTKDSDHYAFLEAGLPALYFGVEDYAQLHRPTDDFDTMTLPFYVHAVETIIAVLREFDGLR